MNEIKKDIDLPQMPLRGWGWLVLGGALASLPMGHHPLQLGYGLMFVFCLGNLRILWRVLTQYQGIRGLIWAVVAYVAICGLGALAADFEGGGVSAARLREHLLALLFCVLVCLMPRQYRLRLSAFIIFGGMVGILVCSVQFFSGAAPFADTLGILEKHRQIMHPALPSHIAGTGLLYDRIAFSIVTVMLAVFCLGLAVHMKMTWRKRLGLTVLTLIFFTGPFFAGSRMGLLLIPMGIVCVLVPFWFQKRKLIFHPGKGVLPLLSFLLLLILVPVAQNHLATSVDLDQNMDRVFIWKRAIETFVDHPILGTGYGHYPEVAPSVYHSSDPFQPSKNHAHNILLTLLAETGLVGLWAFIYLMGQWGKCFWSQRKDPLAYSAFGSCIIFLLASVVHDPWFHSNLLSVFWWFAALACVPYGHKDET